MRSGVRKGRATSCHCLARTLELQPDALGIHPCHALATALSACSLAALIAFLGPGADLRDLAVAAAPPLGPAGCAMPRLSCSMFGTNAALMSCRAQNKGCLCPRRFGARGLRAPKSAPWPSYQLSWPLAVPHVGKLDEPLLQLQLLTGRPTMPEKL